VLCAAREECIKCTAVFSGCAMCTECVRSVSQSWKVRALCTRKLVRPLGTTACLWRGEHKHQRVRCDFAQRLSFASLSSRQRSEGSASCILSKNANIEEYKNVSSQLFGVGVRAVPEMRMSENRVGSCRGSVGQSSAFQCVGPGLIPDQ
jgi:hypothetical protein